MKGYLKKADELMGEISGLVGNSDGGNESSV